MAKDGARALRVGLIQKGRIVEERLVRNLETVTIGTAPGCTLRVPESGLPASFPVLTAVRSGWQLCFDDTMDGHVQSPLGTYDFNHAVAENKTAKKGGLHFLPLQPDQWGRVAIGEVTVLFQFVRPRPVAPRLRLPRAARGNRFRSMDGLFVLVLLVSLGLHVSAYAGLSTIPVREEVTLEEIPDRFAKLLVPERRPEPAKAEEKKAEVAEKKEEKRPEEKRPEPEDPQQAAARKAARAAAVAKAVQQKGILRVLGALGPGTGRGAVADVFGQGGGFGDVAAALSGAGGVAVATEPGAGDRKGGGQGGAASIGDLGTSGGGKVALGTKSEVRVSGTVGVEDADVDSPDIDQQKLGGFVRARMAAIKACYENQLKRNPGLKGRIRIRFTILETGGLADIAAIENTLGSPEVAACILGTMRSWRTPFRPNGTVQVEYPFVFSAS